MGRADGPHRLVRAQLRPDERRRRVAQHLVERLLRPRRRRGPRAVPEAAPAAYNVQLVAMGGPFVTSLLSSCLIGEVLPWTLWPALLVAAVGQVLFVAAQAGLFDSTDAGGAAAFDDIDDEFQDEEQNGGYRLMRRFLLSSSRNGTGEDGGEGVGAPTEVGLTGYDWLGIGLQFVSLFFSAGARVVMKTSADVIKNPADLMAAQYLFCAVPSLLYSSLLAMPPPPQSSSSSSSSSPADPQPSPSSSPLPPHDAFDALDDGGNDGEVIRRLLRGEESHLPPEKAAVGSVWLAWGSLTAADWGMFVLLAVGVVTVAATVQVHCIRVLGPSGHTALQPLRLVFTVAASALLLREPVGGGGDGGGGGGGGDGGGGGRALAWWAEWVGLLIVLAALAWFITVGKKWGLRRRRTDAAVGSTAGAVATAGAVPVVAVSSKEEEEELVR